MAIVNVIGLNKCLEKFSNISELDLMPEIKEATIKVQKSAKDLAPVDTAELQRSIKRKFFPEKQLGIVFTTKSYGPHQEFGFSVKKKNGDVTVVPAQPFMRPALNINRAAIVSSMEKYVKDQMSIGAKGGKLKKGSGLSSESDSNENSEKRTKRPKRRTRVNGGYRITSGGKVTKGAFFTKSQLKSKKK